MSTIFIGIAGGTGSGKTTLPRHLKEHFGDAPECVRQGEGDRLYIDLAGYARRALAGVGVTEVEDCGLSTVADPARFYSYRRDGEKTGRHAALIWIRPQQAPAAA